MVDQTDPIVGEIGERDLLRALLAHLGDSGAQVGPGDDAAVVSQPDGRVVATTDTLVHGPDFRLAWSSPRDLGWKAAAVNLADIAAMGARPTALLVALTLPEATALSLVTGLADGLRDACEHLAPGCGVVGGDLTVSDTLTIAVTALGDLQGRSPVLRSGARPGDSVMLAGDCGVATRGLSILFDRFRRPDGTPISFTAKDRDALDDADRTAVDRQLRPIPPIGQGTAAAEAGATSMMDVSDGLALDASRLAEASGVTLDLSAELIGAEPAALTGGEDHGLLATFPPGTAAPSAFRVIGKVRPRGARTVLVDGSAPGGNGGWDPYRDWDTHRG